jgi:recombination protein RecT
MEENKNTAVAPAKQSEITEQVLFRVNELQQNKQLRLPADYSPENAIKSAYLILQDIDISKCTPASVANTLLSMVVQGLNPDKKQCYFIPYGSKLTLSRSYLGSIALAKRLSKVENVNANVIYKDDEFEYEIDNTTGNVKILKHGQKLENIDDNNIKGAYAILTLSDGSTYVEVMNIAQIKAAWSQGATKGNSPAHTKFSGEMAKKSVINRACKLFINTSDDAALYEEEEIDTDKVQADVKHEVKSNANGAPLDIDDAEIVPPTNEPIVNEPAPAAKPGFAS